MLLVASRMIIECLQPVCVINGYSHEQWVLDSLDYPVIFVVSLILLSCKFLQPYPYFPCNCYIYVNEFTFL